MADGTENVEQQQEPAASAPSWMKRYTEVQPEEKSPGFFEAIHAGFRRENLAYNVLDSMASDKPEDIDLSYRFEEHSDELLKGLPEHMHPSIAREASLDAARYERQRALDDLADQQIIADSGFTGITASLIGGILSPENYIPWTAAASWTNKANRVANAIRLGLVTAGTAAGTEAVLASQDYTKDGEDVLYAATFGFALGGAVGGIVKPKIDTPAPRAADDVAAEATPPTAASGVRESVTDLTDVYGPPRPQTVTRDAVVSTGRRAERRTGPIEVAARIEAEEALESLPNLDTVSKAKRARVQEDVSRTISRLDPEANIGSDVAERLDKAYEFAGIEPRGTKRVTVSERVAGTWDELQADMKAAGARLRDDMDRKLVDDAVQNTDDSVGAARNRAYDPQIVDTSGTEDDVLDAANDWAQSNRVKERMEADLTNTAAVKSKILSSDFTRLMNHPSNVVKRIANDLLEGGTGTMGRQNSAAMYKDMYERRILSRGMIPLNEEAAAWAKSSGYGFWKRNFHTEARAKFDRQVREVLESRTVGRTTQINDPHVIRAADKWDEMMEEALNIGKKSGWEAMQDIPTRKGYVPLQWNGASILRVGKRRSQQLISKGYQSVDIPKEMADEIAQAVVKRAIDGTAGVDTNIAGLLQKNQRGQLRTALEQMGLTDDRINGMMRVLDAREAKAGPSFTKGRTKIDLNQTINDLSLIDLVDNDLNAIASKYARDVSGRSAMSKKGFTNDTVWNTWKSAAMKDNARLKQLADGNDDNLSEFLDDVKSYFTATPIAGGINKNARRIQQFATISSLGMVGAAQLAELGTVVGRLGLKAASKAMPAVDEIVTLARTPKKAGGVIDELRPLLGEFDYDHLLYRPDIVIDDKISGAMDLHTWGKVLDKGLGRGSVMLGYASGMNTVRHMEHRMAAKMMINKFADLAKNPSTRAKSAARMEDIGMNPKQLDDAIAQINRHGVFDEKGTLTEIGLTKWPEETAEQFAIAINRHTAQVVQRQLAGETSNWMHKTIGSLLTQFRHFPMVAFEKQLLRNLRHHDQATMSTIMYGFAVSYGLQSIKAALSDRELEQEDLIKQTINYMGMASVLPEIGTVANQLGIAPDVLNTRKMGHTGNMVDEFDIIDYIPAAGQLNKFAKAGALPGKALTGDVSDADVRGAFMALPMSTTIFGKMLMQMMLED